MTTAPEEISTLSDGDVKSVKNDIKSSLLKGITYYVDGKLVDSINNTSAPDFFEINGTPIVAFANN